MKLQETIQLIIARLIAKENARKEADRQATKKEWAKIAEVDRLVALDE